MIGRALKVTREFHRMKQIDLARSLEISPSFLSEIESGQKTPSLQLLERYGRIFRVPPSTFLLFLEKAADSGTETYSKKHADRLLQFLEWVMEEDADEGHSQRHGKDSGKTKTVSA